MTKKTYKTRNTWHSLAEVPDFSRSKDGILRIMLTNGKEMQPMGNCTEDNFKYMHLYYYGAKAWAYYGDLLPDETDEPPVATEAYEFVGDSEKIYHWLFNDNLKLIGTGNFKYGDEVTDEDKYIITIWRDGDRYDNDCIRIAYTDRKDFDYTIDGDPMEYVRRLVEERHIRVIAPTKKEE